MEEKFEKELAAVRKKKGHRKPDHLKKVTKKDINTAQIMV